MPFQLNQAEARVLGCLLEKEATTPEYYPLSLNGLTNACNQKSNRDPVVSYDESTVEEALASLRAQKLVTRISGADMRVPKHAHRLSEVFNLGRREQAVLCVLLLRGPQTLGELRGRTERMYAFDDLAAVESCLQRLMEWAPDPLVIKISRQSGFKEPRFAHLLCGPVESLPEPAAPLVAEPDRLARLERSLEDLQSEVAALRDQIESFRRQFE